MGLKQDLTDEPVSSLELRELVATTHEVTGREAVAMMRQARLGFVVVLDDEGRPAGMFTERLVIKLLVDGKSLDEPISQYVKAPAPCIADTEPIARLVEMMQSRGLRFVVVVNAEGRAIGVTGQKGLMEYVAEHFPRQVKVQEMDNKLYMSQREGA